MGVEWKSKKLCQVIPAQDLAHCLPTLNTVLLHGEKDTPQISPMEKAAFHVPFIQQQM